MISTKITFEDNSLSELKDKVLIEGGELYAVSGLSEGMSSGKPSVLLTVAMPDGTFVCAQTSLLLFQTIARAMAVRYGDLTGGQDINA